jgi:hypothetical protein
MSSRDAESADSVVGENSHAHATAQKRNMSIGERVDRAVQADKLKITRLTEEVRNLKTQLASAKRGTGRIRSIPGQKRAKKPANIESEE